MLYQLRYLLHKTTFGHRYQLQCCLNFTRLISTTSLKYSYGKFNHEFASRENDMMYKHLKLHKNYRETIAFIDYVNETSAPEDVELILNSDLSQVPTHNLVDNFRAVLRLYCSNPQKLGDPKFVKFCKFLIDKVPQLLDDQLFNVLKVLTLWPRTIDTDRDLFFRFCKTIDEELCTRSSTWSRDKMLLSMDHFHRLGVMHYSSFVWNSLAKLCRNPHRLTSTQLVQSMFLFMCNRKRHPAVDSFEWQDAMAANIYEFSAEEAAIIALGFFKLNKKITNINLLNGLIQKLQSRVDTLDSVTLTALMKILRFSVPCGMRFRLLPLLDALKDVIDKHSLACCTHAALLGTREPIFHEELLIKIFSVFVKEMSNARLKEIERMIFTASLFNFNPDTNPNFFERAVEELKIRDTEISNFPKSLIYSVQFLCVKGFFDYNLMNKVLSKDFLIETFERISKFVIPCNVVEIACSAKLDCPDYNGSTLDVNLINKFNEHYNFKSCAVKNKCITKREIIYLQSCTKLEELFGGSQFVHLAHVLPYSNAPHVIFCRKDGRPVVIPEEIRAKHYVDFEPASKIGDWHAIELWSTGSEIGNTGKPVGSTRSKLRHLRLLGYKCCLLKEEKWEDLNTDKIQYLKSLIESSS